MDKIPLFLVFLGVFLVLCQQYVYASVKKGVAVGPKNFLCDDFKSLDNMFWWYDWGPNLHMIQKYSNCTNLDQYLGTFVPMIWGPWNIPKTPIPDQAAYILGFNEPNHMEQSNLPADKAAKYWPQIEELSKGRLLVSPSASPCGGPRCRGNATEWFDLFFKYCQGCRVDYLATHFYGCSADNAMKFLSNLYERYKKKIWLTEFACPYSASPNKQRNFMKKLLPVLDAAPFIYRYSWYASRVKGTGFVTSAASLLEPESSTLTDLGRFYNSYSTAENEEATYSILVRIDMFFKRVLSYILNEK